jgi:hypothetical protein
MIDVQGEISNLDNSIHLGLPDISSLLYTEFYWSEQMEALEWVLEGVYEE